MQPPIRGSEMVAGDAGSLVAYMLLGSGDAPGLWANAMPAYDSLSDDELAALLTYVRARFGNAGPIAPGLVAEIRSQLF